MNIIFHSGINNNDRPERFNFVTSTFTDLANTFEELGNTCLLLVHPKSVHPNLYKNFILLENMNDMNLDFFRPDFVFTWNGNMRGDKLIKKKYKNNKIIYGELSIFEHKDACYFNFLSNGSHSNFLNRDLNIDLTEDYKNDRDLLANKFKKERLFNDRYVFVPLQDNEYTYLLEYSYVKNVTDLLIYVENLYIEEDDIKILYKQHPNSIIDIDLKLSDKFIEVKEDAHHYLPYAEKVIGITTNCLTETLLYHDRVLALGECLASRKFKDDDEIYKYISMLYRNQLYWCDLKDKIKIENSYFYKKMKNN